MSTRNRCRRAPGRRRTHLRAVGSDWLVGQHFVWPVRLLVHWPAEQAVHLVEPAAALNELAAQAAQSLTEAPPVVAREVPAGHSVVAVCAAPGQYAPAAHAKQLDLPAAGCRWGRGRRAEG